MNGCGCMGGRGALVVWVHGLVSMGECVADGTCVGVVHGVCGCRYMCGCGCMGRCGK